MSKKYLNNSWYCGAWATEVTTGLFHRVIAGQDILFFRDKAGEPTALSNFCPHRSAPLHLGKLLDDKIECPYHGLQYGLDGKCVHNPHHPEGEPQKSACLQQFPIVEQHDLLWIWMGDPDLADSAAIPDFSCHTDKSMAKVFGVIEMKAYYELITDNLLDLTHASYVHEGVLGSEGIINGEQEVISDGTTIYVNRWCPDHLAPPAWDKAFGDYGKPMDHWLYMRWDAPAHMLLDVGVTPTGKTRQEGLWVYGTDILTPQDETTTHYFWAITYNKGIDNPEVAKMWEHTIDFAFGGQDKPMIEAQQKMINLRGGVDIEDLESIWLDTDSGPKRARLMLKKLMAKKSAIPEPKNPGLRECMEESDKAKDKSERIIPAV